MYDCPEWPLLSQGLKRLTRIGFKTPEFHVRGKLALSIFQNVENGSKEEICLQIQIIYIKKIWIVSEKFYMDNAEDESQRLNASSMNTRVH